MAALFFFLFFLSSFPHKSLSFQKCPATYFVGNGSQPPVTVQFPFITSTGDQFNRCGFPGFNLTSSGQTPFISLPSSSGNFTVVEINYTAQTISLSDPNNCLPNQILTLNLTNSPFSSTDSRNYTFLNCSDGARVMDPAAVAVACLSGSNFTVYMASGEKLGSETGQCRPIKSVLAPIMLSRSEILNQFDSGTAFMRLTWNVPDCRRCMNSDFDRVYYNEDGGVCRFKGESVLEVECSGDSKALRLVRNILIGVIVVIVFVCLVVMIYCCIKSSCAGKARPENNNVSS